MYVCMCIYYEFLLHFNTFPAYCSTGGSFKTVKGIKKSLFFRSRKNNINVAHFKHEIIIARTYPIRKQRVN